MGAVKQAAMDAEDARKEKREIAECLRCGDPCDPFPHEPDETFDERIQAEGVPTDVLCDYCEHMSSKDD
jgi:hypothetical protein